MSMQSCSTVVAACLLCVLALCTGQDPIVEDVCMQEGFPGVNLSCEQNSTIRSCFPRNELCDGIPFCADGSDEGPSTGTGLDCEVMYYAIENYSYTDLHS